VICCFGDASTCAHYSQHAEGFFFLLLSFFFPFFLKKTGRRFLPHTKPEEVTRFLASAAGIIASGAVSSRPFGA